MPSPPTTRDRVVDATIALVRRQGYAGTGLKQIAASGEAQWSSLYHYFPAGKEQLIGEAIGVAAERYAPLIRRLFSDPADFPAAARAFFDLAAKALEQSDFADGCPVATAALEAASTSGPLREAAAAAFELWVDHATRPLLEAGVDEAQARRVTQFGLAALEGAILLSRVRRSAAPLRETGEIVEAALEAMLAAPPPPKRTRRR